MAVANKVPPLPPFFTPRKSTYFLLESKVDGQAGHIMPQSSNPILHQIIPGVLKETMAWGCRHNLPTLSLATKGIYIFL
jgi:hypothetical protein